MIRKRDKNIFDMGKYAGEMNVKRVITAEYFSLFSKDKKVNVKDKLNNGMQISHNE
jgi:hypothetical protein